MKDAGQKDLLYGHFRTQGWFALVEVPIVPRGGADRTEKLITDVDVYALRPTPELTWEGVIGDCKTKRGESPVNRALWVRALMGYTNAAHGYIILKRETSRIEADHRLMADQIGVSLLDEEEFVAFDRALLYPRSSDRSPYETATQLRGFYEAVQSRFHRFESLTKFCMQDAWSERDHFVMLRQIIGIVDKARVEFDPAQPLHLALVLEAAAVFAVALATCSGRVFHQFTAPTDRAALEETLRCMIWGGRERYEAVVQLRNELLERGRKATGVQEPDVLGLPEWSKFVQLIRGSLEAPRLMFRVPGVLRTLAMQEAGILSRGTNDAMSRVVHPMVLKLALSTATYLSEASRLPREMTERISNTLVGRIAALLEERASPTTQQLKLPAFRVESTVGSDAPTQKKHQ